MIKAEIILDSISHSGSRLTTFSLVYPRFIHSEFMTHRMFSRNASSSRAIPVKKQIEMVENCPAVPLAFTKNQKGMQGGDPLDEESSIQALQTWQVAMSHAVRMARSLADLNVHKQYANRLLEPFSHISVLCTATDYANFFALRTHKDAQPEFQKLAELMYEKYSTNEPDKLVEGEWHLPYVTPRETNKAVNGELNHSDLIKMSVARCARVSYLTHEGTQPSIEKDLELYNRLVGSAPIHASPTEHQAVALTNPNEYSGNFKGWLQYRKTLSNENILNFQIPSKVE